jgi:uncharacterized protein (TIGR00369 family)
VLRPQKHIADSRITLSSLLGPQDANNHGNVHGGVIMKMVDEAGALVAMRHAQTQVVTVAIDSMTFMKPIYVGSLVTCDAEITYVGRSSMEVRVQVRAENPLTGAGTITNIAYLVYVALAQDGTPTTVPELIYDTPQQQTRAAEAQERQAYRKKQRTQEEAYHE